MSAVFPEPGTMDTGDTRTATPAGTPVMAIRRGVLAPACTGAQVSWAVAVSPAVTAIDEGEEANVQGAAATVTVSVAVCDTLPCVAVTCSG